MSELVIISSLKAQSLAGGQVGLTRKFVDGVVKASELWPGPVTVIAEPTDRPDSNLDHIAIDPAAQPFALEVLSFQDRSGLTRLLGGEQVVLASLDPNQTHLANLCSAIHVPIVYISEYS